MYTVMQLRSVMQLLSVLATCSFTDNCHTPALLQTELTPNQCRLRDQTYSAPITVDVEYTRWVL